MTRRYSIATEWGDLAEADTYAGALLARKTLAAEHRPKQPDDLRGITIAIYADAGDFPEGPRTPDEYRAEAESAEEPLRTWLLDQADLLQRRGVR